MHTWLVAAICYAITNIMPQVHSNAGGQTKISHKRLQNWNETEKEISAAAAAIAAKAVKTTTTTNKK